MPTSTSSELRTVVLADSDTRWKWGVLTARRLVPGARIDGRLLRGRATPTPRQLAEVGVRVDSVEETTGTRFVREAAGWDVVVLACVGGAVQAMLHGMAHAGGQDAGRPDSVRRPVVVTGYVGVVYEKLADGLLLRHGADVVLANSPDDADRFRAVYEGVGADPSAVTEGALPFLGSAPSTPRRTAGAPHADRVPDEPPGAEERPFTVVFAVQPSVPAGRADRLYLLRRAAEHARSHPEREVLVKLRSRPGEHTTHIEEQPYQRLASRLPGGLPANCRLVYGHMSEVLDRTDLLVTVSSTAALESLHRGIPTAVLTDLGVREILGNPHFIGSGCLTSWDRLDAGELPEADPHWSARQGVGHSGDDPLEEAFGPARERVAKLAACDGLPPITPYYTAATAPGYLPGILARHGFGPHGEPLADGAPHEETDGPARAVRAAVRSALRNTARGAYRHGVQRVAPVIRRLGDL